ncbi:MAG: aminotransferase class I/II-fold pyridoxal phosphate-dependent enzyme [Lachnospiraceae bacterium]|nr:aminotransferase class I/II-fold pyridoxal phosphate-dependent enzyme [Lachnospiraceae bacterium]
MRYHTAVLHAGSNELEKHGATLPPIYQSSAFAQQSAESLAGIFENKAPGYCYTRVANPTVSAFENRITKLEGGMASVACASGMAALTTAFLNILQAGDEIITSASLYGGTIDLFRDLESFGIRTVFVENNDWDTIEGAINENTKLIFAETIGNPGLDVTDIKKLSELAHAHGLPLIVDNTTATSYLIRPLEWGADIVVNSSSKYINGNSSAISGILTDRGRFKWSKEKYPMLTDYVKFGPMAYICRMRATIFRNFGACLSPQNAYLNLLGVETLGLRMERQCENAYKLASWIEDNYPEIKVNYPGLESSPWNLIAKEQFTKGYGAIFTMRVGSKERAFALINALKLALKVSNIGDTKTLVIHPESTISLHSTPKQKEEAGVYEDLIRVSVGIEDLQDLMEDFQQAIEHIENTKGEE